MQTTPLKQVLTSFDETLLAFASDLGSAGALAKVSGEEDTVTAITDLLDYVQGVHTRLHNLNGTSLNHGSTMGRKGGAIVADRPGTASGPRRVSAEGNVSPRIMEQLGGGVATDQPKRRGRRPNAAKAQSQTGEVKLKKDGTPRKKPGRKSAAERAAIEAAGGDTNTADAQTAAPKQRGRRKQGAEGQTQSQRKSRTKAEPGSYTPTAEYQPFMAQAFLNAGKEGKRFVDLQREAHDAMKVRGILKPADFEHIGANTARWVGMTGSLRQMWTRRNLIEKNANGLWTPTAEGKKEFKALVKTIEEAPQQDQQAAA